MPEGNNKQLISSHSQALIQKTKILACILCERIMDKMPPKIKCIIHL